MIIDQLNFVKSAIKKRAITDLFMHFFIGQGRITASNGEITLSSPIDSDLEIQPQADKMLKALNSCDQETSISLTKTGNLKIASGEFKAYVPCTTSEAPAIVPEGTKYKLQGDFLKALAIVEPFIGVDASRPWCTGVLFKGDKLIATNNVTLICVTTKTDTFTEEVNIPARAVEEILRIGEVPLRVQKTDYCITFHYSGDRWLKTQLLDLKWPPVEKLLGMDKRSEYKIDKDFKFDLEKVKPFCDESNRVFISPAFIGSHGRGVEQGARIEKQRDLSPGIFNIDQLIKVVNVAKHIDLGYYPKACPFRGKNIQGVIAGMLYSG